jgi:DNA repair exonuclease SbcCD ATPase subunit
MEVLRAKFDELRELNDRVSFELMMKYEWEELKAKLQELTTFINHANNQDNFKELLRENDDFVPFFKEKFWIDEIRPKRKLQEKIRAAKEKLPDDLPRNFTDIAERIRNVTDVSAMGSIAEAFKNVNISR